MTGPPLGWPLDVGDNGDVGMKDAPSPKQSFRNKLEGNLSQKPMISEDLMGKKTRNH